MSTLNATAPDALTREICPPLATRVAGLFKSSQPSTSLAKILEDLHFAPRTALPSPAERHLASQIDIRHIPPVNGGACVGYLTIRPHDGTYQVPDGLAILRSGPFGPFHLAEVSNRVACATGRYRRTAYCSLTEATSAGRRLVTTLQTQAGISPQSLKQMADLATSQFTKSSL